MKEMRFYIDDSGTRMPDKNIRPFCLGRADWFALGGVLIKEEDEDEARGLHAQFCLKWEIDYPLHSSDIRFKTNKFEWLKKLSQSRSEEFYSDLERMLVTAPVLGLACVIDRPGYNARYLERYGRQRWQLCKTAFSVILERAAKQAINEGRRLRIHPERADKKSDAWLKGYYDQLRLNGMPFADGGNPKYAPLSVDEFRTTLYEFKPKYKSSTMVQLADLYLYPICRGRYTDYRPMHVLRDSGKLIDCHLEDDIKDVLGIKYSCFDLHDAEKAKGPQNDPFASPNGTS